MLNSNAWPRDLSSNVRFEMYRNANEGFLIEINVDIWNAAQMIEKFITKSTKNGFFWWRTMKKAIVEMNLGKSTIVSVLLRKIYEIFWWVLRKLWLFLRVFFYPKAQIFHEEI